MKKWLAVLALVVCVGLGFLVGLIVRWPTSGGGGSAGGGLAAPTKGVASAPVRIIEISDFQCPFCGKGAMDVLPQVLKAYPGKVSIEFHHNPLPMHPFAIEAAKASMAAHLQGRFWEMHDLLFRNRASLDPDKLVSLAGQLGLDVDRFRWDMGDPRIERLIRDDQAVTAQLKLQGVPMFLINGRLLEGAQPLPSSRRSSTRSWPEPRNWLHPGCLRKRVPRRP